MLFNRIWVHCQETMESLLVDAGAQQGFIESGIPCGISLSPGFGSSNTPEIGDQDACPSASEILLILPTQLRETIGIPCHDTVEGQLLL